MALVENVAPISRTEKLERPLAGAGLGVMGIGAAAVWYFDPTRAGIFPPCPLLAATGFACPGCGLTRGFHALFHGDIMTAMDFNALIPLFVLIFGYFFVSMVLVVVRGYAFPRWTLSLPAIWGLLGLMLVFGVVRNLPFYPFNILYP